MITKMSLAIKRGCSGNGNPRRRNGVFVPILAAVICLIMVGGGMYYFWNSTETEDEFSPITAKVTRGEFVAQVLDQGEVQSSENIEIRCEAKARNGTLTVIRVVPEGTLVKEGDFLVQLDATGFEKELEQQKVVMANAETQKISAETKLATATAALQEYTEGTYVEAKKTIENEVYDAEAAIATAQQNKKQSEANYLHSKKLAAKAYITQQALQSSEFAVKNAEIQVTKAENMLELAEKKLSVLEEITKKKFILQYESDIRAAEVTLSSQIEAYEVEKGKINEIKAMMAKCTIVVPKGVSGQVVYSKESSWGGQDWMLAEGGSVRENQVLIRLPNPDKMEVKALINEQSITQIEIGMPAKIRVDALNSKTLTGVVTKVNQYAEQSSGRMSTNIRKYAAMVKILSPPPSLRPGMNASVSIQTKYQESALIAPIQTVYGVQDKQFCLVKREGGVWDTREVKTVGENAQFVMIKEGLSEGDELVMNPAAYKEHMTLPEFKLDNKIDVGAEGAAEAAKAKKRKTEGGEGGPGAGPGEGGGRTGMANVELPASGAALISKNDKNGDGMLTKEEAGSPYTFFFDRIDTDKNSLLSAAELDVSINTMRQMRASGGGGGGRTGQGGPPGAPQERPQGGSPQGGASTATPTENRGATQ